MIKELGLEHYYVLLKELNKGDKIQSELWAVYPSSQIFVKLRVLEKYGFVEIEERREGKVRFKLYKITDKGKKLFELFEKINSLAQT